MDSIGQGTGRFLLAAGLTTLSMISAPVVGAAQPPPSARIAVLAFESPSSKELSEEVADRLVERLSNSGTVVAVGMGAVAPPAEGRIAVALAQSAAASHVVAAEVFECDAAERSFRMGNYEGHTTFFRLRVGFLVATVPAGEILLEFDGEAEDKLPHTQSAGRRADCGVPLQMVDDVIETAAGEILALELVGRPEAPQPEKPRQLPGRRPARGEAATAGGSKPIQPAREPSTSAGPTSREPRSGSSAPRSQTPVSKDRPLTRDEIDKPDGDGYTLLQRFSASGKAATVQSFIEQGANVHVRMEDGGLQAVHLAAYSGDPATLRAVLDAGADPDSRTENGETALHWAARNGKTDAVRLLIAAGADLNLRDVSEATPLLEALWEDHHETVSLLLESGARYEVPTFSESGFSSLHIAAMNGEHADVEVLLAAGADPDIPTRDGTGATPLHLAAFFGRLEVVETLIAAGADVERMDANERPAFVLAVTEGHDAVAKVLLGAPVGRAAAVERTLSASRAPLDPAELCHRRMGFYRNTIDTSGLAAIRTMPADVLGHIAECAKARDIDGLYLSGLAHAVGTLAGAYPQSNDRAIGAWSQAAEMGDLESARALAFSYALQVPLELERDIAAALGWAEAWARIEASAGGGGGDLGRHFAKRMEELQALEAEAAGEDRRIEEEMERLEVERQKLLEELGRLGG